MSARILDWNARKEIRAATVVAGIGTSPAVLADRLASLLLMSDAELEQYKWGELFSGLTAIARTLAKEGRRADAIALYDDALKLRPSPVVLRERQSLEDELLARGIAINRMDDYGDPLPTGALFRIGTTRLTHPGAHTLAISPNRRLLASASEGDRKIRVWDIETGGLVFTVPTRESVGQMQFSRDSLLGQNVFAQPWGMSGRFPFHPTGPG